MVTYNQTKRLNTVSIIAMGPSGSDYFSSYGVGAKKDGEVWAINHAGLWYPGVDLIFAMDDMKRDMGIDKPYVMALRKSPLPKMTCTVHYDNCIAYPIEAVLKDIYDTDAYLSIAPPLDNTCTFALAYAIHRKVKRINLFGFDFYARDHPEELIAADRRWHKRLKDPPAWFAYHDYLAVIHRRPREPGAISTAYMAGLAAGRGIDVRVSANSVFCDFDRSLTIHGYDDYGAEESLA